MQLVANRDRMGDKDLLRVIVGIGGCRDLIILPRVGISSCRETSQILKDTLESYIDVGIYDDRDEEDSNAPAMRKTISQVKSLAPYPAPVATNVAIGPKCEADGTYDWQLAKLDLRESVDR